MYTNFILRNAKSAIKNNRYISNVSMIKMPFNKEHYSLKNMVKEFVLKEVEPQANEYNRKEKFNKDLFKRLGDIGLLGLTADTNYGGLGLDSISSCIVHQELSRSDPGLCLAYLAHSLLFVNNLSFNGNQYQKQKFLEGAINGNKIGSIGIIESSRETNVFGMKTQLNPINNKWDGDLILHGSKMWITNGCINENQLGDYFLIYGKTVRHFGLTMVIVEKGMPGFTLGRNIKNKCGLRSCGTGELYFSNVIIPKKNIVGEIGNASISIMRNLEIERLALASISHGIAERLIESMVKYTNDRNISKKSNKKIEQIQRMINKSCAEFQAGQSYLYNTASQLDLYKSNTILYSDGVKLYSTTMAKKIADRAMEVLGDDGYIEDYTVERLCKDAKLIDFIGKTTELHDKK